MRTNSDLEEILSQALAAMKAEEGSTFDIEHINLAELGRRTNIPRHKLRRIQKNGFKVLPNGNKGRKASETVMTGYTGVVDNLLKSNVTNSEVIYERICSQGYSGGVSMVKDYIAKHRDLVPAKREIVSSQGNRGRRYSTGPGECYQMDWGFVKVVNERGQEYKVACFAMICHHCGERYVEFFPNARQESLFIGMIHAFIYMGVPQTVLTDNMKSVTTGRDADGKPIWQKDYAVFMKVAGFKTKLCKARHPFTKGKVDFLIFIRILKHDWPPL